jgi:hypothetical protein
VSENLVPLVQLEVVKGTALTLAAVAAAYVMRNRPVIGATKARRKAGR